MTKVATFVQHVTAQLGEQEHPLGSNHTRYGKEFGWDGVSWCAEFGWDMYHDVGVSLPVKSAACVGVYDVARKDGYLLSSPLHCLPGDSLIRTWEHKSRENLNPAETHYQLVVGTHLSGGALYLELIGGNQGPGVVSRDLVRATDPSILGGLAFSKLFEHPHTSPVQVLHYGDVHALPAAKSHKYPHAFMSLGSHGSLVTELQTKLAHLNDYHGRIDGSFGPQTLGAVRAFQHRHWPHDPHQWDGIVGPLTYSALGF